MLNTYLLFILLAVVFVGLGKCLLKKPVSARRLVLFALLNIVGVLGLLKIKSVSVLLGFSLYLLILVLHHRLLLSGRKWSRFGALWVPVFLLVFIKYFMNSQSDALILSAFIGISYMSFRLTHLAMEVQNGTVPIPSLAEYLGFAFYLPTLLIGPINPYRFFYQSVQGEVEFSVSVPSAIGRMILGVFKYLVIANIANQLSYDGLLLDGNPHSLVDFVIAAIGYAVFIYCNFSGVCDLVIGGSALLGIRLHENFDQPYLARNVKDFWNRWHITLSLFMRDVVFTPLSKKLVSLFGPGNLNHAIGAAIFFVFILVGVWHGVGWNYFIFGVLHAFGVTANHYYAIGLKKLLPAEQFRAYHENRWIRRACCAVTFCYVLFGFFFFANDIETMKQIFQILVW